jgi:hypothetical protein
MMMMMMMTTTTTMMMVMMLKDKLPARQYSTRAAEMRSVFHCSRMGSSIQTAKGPTECLKIHIFRLSCE